MTPARRAAALAVGAFGAASLWVARSSALQWGATAGEARALLPGDDEVPGATVVATHAITVHAPVEKVWPWVAQIGQGRAGFYSYDVLENLVGCDIHSATTVVPQWQDVAVGDVVRIHPDVPLDVVAVDPDHALVLRAPGPPYAFTWSFVLRRHAGRSTRLITRERYALPGPAGRLGAEAVAAASTIMSRKMLRGIRDRAERTQTSET